LLFHKPPNTIWLLQDVSIDRFIFSATDISSDALVRVARVAYRIVQIEVDDDQLDSFSDVSPWSQGDLTLDAGRVDERVVRRHDGAITTSRRAG